MQRIGILDVDALTEEVIRGLFQAVPDVHVFLSPGHSERAQRLAIEFPCWTLDSHQAVADEVDVIVRSIGTNAPDELLKGVTLSRTHIVVSLASGAQLQSLTGLPPKIDSFE